MDPAQSSPEYDLSKFPSLVPTHSIMLSKAAGICERGSSISFINLAWILFCNRTRTVVRALLALRDALSLLEIRRFERVDEPRVDKAGRVPLIVEVVLFAEFVDRRNRL